MDENKNTFNLDELLDFTARNKNKNFDISEVESIDAAPIDELDDSVVEIKPAEAPAPVVEVKPVDTPAPVDEVNPIAKEEISQSDAGFCIIDETSTSVTFEEGPDVSVNELIPSKKAKKPKPTGKIKFNPLQIVLMAVVGVIALWCIAFTVDHTLAANGISPVFSIKSAEYEDQSVSYKGLGYKIQFKFDSNKNLTQVCVPFWKDGPNDIDHAENK